MNTIINLRIILRRLLDYIAGNLRYQLYYSKFSIFIRSHIHEQITFRIEMMDISCYKRGSCIICGCSTTALQMCSRSCDKPCYPKFLSKKRWNKFLSDGNIDVDGIKWSFTSKSSDDNTIKWILLINDKIEKIKIYSVLNKDISKISDKIKQNRDE